MYNLKFATRIFSKNQKKYINVFSIIYLKTFLELVICIFKRIQKMFITFDYFEKFYFLFLLVWGNQ